MAGTPIEKIAGCLNLHDDTLRKHFRYEIMTGRERLKGDAVRVVVDSLTDNSLDAAKFVLGRVAGWTEKSVVDNTSSDGSMSPKAALDVSRLSPEALAEIVALGDEPDTD
jgi:hypothetical protein